MLDEGSLTRHVIDRYCGGVGVEIGPGDRPYGPVGRTVMVDRLTQFAEQTVQPDVLGAGERLPLADGSVDFVIASHCLEHIPDALGALREWRRVLTRGGTLLLVMPHMDRIWDRGRTPATWEHLSAEVGAVDPFDDDHWGEFQRVSLPRIEDEASRDLAIHPWTADPRSRDEDGWWNVEWLAGEALIHYHAWTQHELADVLIRMGFHVLVVVEELPERADSFLIVASRRD